MQPDEQTLIRERQESEAWNYRVWMMQLANKYGNKYSEYHPDYIKAEIKTLQRLLKEAKV